jgi:aspartyl/asparaginyl-tRNA synthetase
MKTKLTKSLAVLLTLSICVIAYAATQVRWDEADKYYGQTVTVTGKIVATYNSGKACFLNFHQDWKHHFSAVIFASDFANFPSNPEQFYLNKEVKITGLVKEYEGKPEIVLKEPAQIEVVTATLQGEPESKTVQQATSSTNDLAKQVELLSKTIESQESRIKALEQRVEKLESALDSTNIKPRPVIK